MAENVESIIIWGRVCLRRCSQSESGSFWPQSQGLFDHLNHLRTKATSASSFFSGLGFASGAKRMSAKPLQHWLKNLLRMLSHPQNGPCPCLCPPVLQEVARGSGWCAGHLCQSHPMLEASDPCLFYIWAVKASCLESPVHVSSASGRWNFLKKGQIRQYTFPLATWKQINLPSRLMSLVSRATNRFPTDPHRLHTHRAPSELPSSEWVGGYENIRVDVIMGRATVQFWEQAHQCTARPCLHKLRLITVCRWEWWLQIMTFEFSERMRVQGISFSILPLVEVARRLFFHWSRISS